MEDEFDSYHHYSSQLFVVVVFLVGVMTHQHYIGYVALKIDLKMLGHNGCMRYILV